MTQIRTSSLGTIAYFALLISCEAASAGLIRGPYDYSIGPYRGQQWSYFESYNYFGVANVQTYPYWANGAVWPDYWNSPYLWGSGSRYSSLFGRRPGYYNPINPAYLTPPRAPGYTKQSARDVVLPPLNHEPGLAAVIDIKMPCFGELWVDGIATEQLGTDRLFRSPPLDRGAEYVYEVKARWFDSVGKPTEQTQLVRVHSGERVLVVFPKPAPTLAPAP